MRLARSAAAALMFATLLTAAAWAGGPRFVTGTTYANGAGNPMPFYTTQPMYFTDPGELSSTVTKAQADAMVAVAAGVWNVPSSSLVLKQGGSLAEHVNSVKAITHLTQQDIPMQILPENSR
jgi:hypothetical protein